MKISFFLLFTILFQLSATSSYSQEKKLSVSGTDISLRSLFNHIEKQSEFLFFYVDADVEGVMVSVNVQNSSINSVLNQALSKTRLLYEINDRYVTIAPKTVTSVPSQSIIVTGLVTDETGAPMPGVNVTIKGTTTGAVSDINGRFSINVPNKDAVLMFSFIGYESQEFVVGNQTSITIMMNEDTREIEEVVVVGYGTVKKSDLTGAVASVSSKDFGDRSAGGISDLLVGKASGVQVTNNMIHIRGVTTINNTAPLVVIDGMLGGALQTVHPSDIESIEVLKDASATAIYGARGANGVLLVTTKKGKEGKPQLDFNTFLSFAYPSNRYDLLKARDYMELLKETKLNGNTTPAQLYTYSKLFNPDGSFTDYVLQDRTNWDEEVQKNAFSQEYTLSVRGGSEKATYSVSGAFNNGKSTAGTSHNQAYIFSENTEFKLFKDRLKLGQSLRFRYTKATGANADMRGLRMPPYSPTLDENVLGGHAIVTTITDLNDAVNPTTGLDSDIYSPLSRSMRLMAQFYGELEIFSWLKFNTNFGVSLGNSSWSSYSKPNANGNLVNPDSQYNESFSYDIAPRLENYLTFTKSFGIHDISAMVGNSYENNILSRNLGVFGEGYQNDNVHNVMVAKNARITGNGGTHYAYLSYFGRLNYSLLNRYLLTFNFRADASPKFSPINRWGYFPSVAVGWKIHEESFMKDISWLDQLKLRASYGLTGNDGIDDFLYFSSIHSYPKYAFPDSKMNDPTYYNGVTIVSSTNPDIKWEETENISFGLDFGFLKNRLQVTADYFIKNTYDILFAVPQPLSLGMGLSPGDGNAMANAASVRNQGVEFSISYRGTAGDLSYQVMGNGTYVKNKVTGLGSGTPYTGTAGGLINLGAVSRTEEGFPIGYFYGYKMDKVYATQAEVDADNQKAPGGTYDLNGAVQAGDIRFIDVNEDGVVDVDDRTYLGSSIPKFSYGFSASAQYKGFDFSMSWYGVAGNSLLNGYEYYMDGMINTFNATTKVLNRWHSESNPGNGRVPRAVEGDPANNTRMSDRYMYNGAYLRLDLISLGYTLPESWMNRTGGFIKSVRLYVSSDRLFTITGYPGVSPVISGIDPDASYANTVRGVDNGNNFANRTLRFGLSVKF